jgi:hypothetical protein
MRVRGVLIAAVLVCLDSCGGGDAGNLVPGGGAPPPFTSVTQVRVSLPPSSITSNCDGVAPTGTLYTGTVAEPYLAVSPLNPANLIAAWQQNRWSDGGAQAIGMAKSVDGGFTWTPASAAFSRCTGGSSANAGDYARATDVWVSIAPNGVAYALSLSFTGNTLASGSSSAMLVSSSSDGGASWSLPIALVQDGASFFNDKGSITADPNDSNFVYVVWDRLTGQTAGPTYFSMTGNAGSTWQTARSIYDPGANNQTIGNQILVLPDGTLVNVFTELDTAAGGQVSAAVKVMQSSDHGSTWSTPVPVSSLQAVGTTDPKTGAPVRDGSDLVSAAVAPAGVIFLAWQDSRFSSGTHDGIALTQSADGGATWSTPVEANADPAVPAFTPTLNVRADGVIAVTYFDLRNDTGPATSLFTDCWMVTSSDAVNFTETHLSGPFDLNLAPDSGGLFLGDYQSLASDANDFLPFYVQTNADMGISSDAFISFPPASAVARRQTYRARAAPADTVLPPAARQRVMQRIRLTRSQRLNRTN